MPNAQNTPIDVHVLARYSTGAFSSSAALTEHRLKAGRALYLGWFPNDEQAEALLTHLAAQAGIPILASVPDGMICSLRGSYRILLNFSEEQLKANIHGQTVLLEPRDVKILNVHD
jgi:beta-galactosidase